MSASSRVAAIIKADNAMQEFFHMMQFVDSEEVNEPVVIESDPYLGDPIASLQDSDEDMASLIASYHRR